MNPLPVSSGAIVANECFIGLGGRRARQAMITHLGRCANR